jgi:predicted adenylyl cyclase CyaB
VIERERKYKVPDLSVSDLRKRLENDGRWVRAGAEGDVFFDHPSLHLQDDDRRLRLRFRDEGGVQELTYKSSREMHGVDKVRREITAVLVSGPIEELIAELGFRRIRKFVKLREVYIIGEFEISLDQLEPRTYSEIVDEMSAAGQPTPA